MPQFKNSNAITYRLALMRGKWMESVKPETKAAIWRVELDEVRMVEAFVAIEASEHGEVPAFFVDFSAPFMAYAQYGPALMAHWLERWGNEEARKKLTEAGVLPDWDGDPFKEGGPGDGPEGFLACMSSFAGRIVGMEGRLVMSLMPTHCRDGKALQKWMLDAVAILPDNLCILLHDVEGNTLFGELSKRQDVAILHAKLNMQGAMREIVSAGDPDEPGVKFNLCVLNVGEALGKGDGAGVHHWGRSAVEVGKALQSQPLEATGWVVYGTAVYQLKNYQESLVLYDHAEAIASAGKEAGDPTCAAVLLQVLGMKAAAHLMLKHHEEAIRHYERMALEAGSQGNHLMECEAYRLLAQSPSKSVKDGARLMYLQKGFDAGLRLHPETQSFSSLHLVCIQLCTLAEKEKDLELEKKVSAHAATIWGERWRDLEHDSLSVPMIPTTPNTIPHAAGV